MKQKKAILFCTLLVLLTGIAAAGIQEDFTAANRLYEQGKFAAALPLYLGISRQVTDWKVLFNIGNCHYKLENFLSAKIYYLKARKWRPLDRSLSRNIAMVDRHFPAAASPTKPDFVSRTLQVLESKLSMNMLSAALLLAFLLLNISLFLLLTRGKNKKILYAAAFSLLLVLAIGAYHTGRVAALGRSDSAMIREANSLLRSGPGEDNTVLFKVDPGLEVRIIDRYRDWVQVSASAQIAGWIEKKRLALI
jgi:tetratricopeptide (TPR) repeat protein